MGSNVGNDTNKPILDVTITKSFYMGKYEVTQAEWESIMGNNPSHFQGDNYLPADGEVQENRPVEMITWYDSIVYCNKRSINENLTPCYTINGSSNPETWGTAPTESDDTWNAVVCDWDVNGYRLPTEAEWEYAARAGDDTIDTLIYSGTNVSSNLVDYAWFVDNSESKTHEVGKKISNAFGLFDMSGNVWEWCWNWFTAVYNEEFEGGENPTGFASGTHHVVRGESIWAPYNECSVIIRGSSVPYDVADNLGLRLVRTITEE